jgi:hypothetical protein
VNRPLVKTSFLLNLVLSCTPSPKKKKNQPCRLIKVKEKREKGVTSDLSPFPFNLFPSCVFPLALSEPKRKGFDGLQKQGGNELP